MAIFGDLSELPFPEILGTLARRSGRLHVRADARDYVLHLDGDRLRALSIDDAVVHDPLQLREAVLHLARQIEGRFDFRRDAPENLARHHNLAVTQLLLSTSAVIDELDHYRDRFAPPETRFLLSGDRAPALDPSLVDIAERARPLLSVGASAQDIAAALRLNVERVQLLLYKLRTAGLLVPVRAHTPPAPPPFAPTPALAVPACTPPPAAPGLVSRLLGALRSRRWFA